MKFTAVVSVSLASQLAAAAPQLLGLDLNSLSGLIGLLPAGTVPGAVRQFNAGYGNISDVASSIARRTELKTRNPHIANSKTVKIRYGPFKVPSASRVNIMGEHGSLYNWPMPAQEKPCEGECMLLGVNADLEYADGSNANTGNGMWLHHMVLFATGPKRFDPTCEGGASLPHLLIGSDANHSERLMASGNERTSTRFNSPYTPNEKLGFPLHAADRFDMIVDLMNENQAPQVVYMTMTYDYLEGKPEGFNNFRAIWMDIVKCGTSEKPAPQQTGPFTISQTWTANLNADILGAGGHLHDGGTHITVTIDGKEACDSVASYGITPKNGKAGGGGMMGGDQMGAMSRVVSEMGDFVRSGGQDGGLSKRDGPEHGIAGMPHITKMTTCLGANMGGKVVKGQKWGIHAYYDYDKHGGMKTASGKQSNVMGIVVMMVKNWTS